MEAEHQNLPPRPGRLRTMVRKRARKMPVIVRWITARACGNRLTVPIRGNSLRCTGVEARRAPFPPASAVRCPAATLDAASLPIRSAFWRAQATMAEQSTSPGYPSSLQLPKGIEFGGVRPWMSVPSATGVAWGRIENKRWSRFAPMLLRPRHFVPSRIGRAGSCRIACCNIAEAGTMLPARIHPPLLAGNAFEQCRIESPDPLRQHLSSVPTGVRIPVQG